MLRTNLSGNSKSIVESTVVAEGVALNGVISDSYAITCWACESN